MPLQLEQLSASGLPSGSGSLRESKARADSLLSIFWPFSKCEPWQDEEGLLQRAERGETGHIDLDTARLYLTLKAKTPKLPDSAANQTAVSRPWVQVVPASFYRHFPALGGDGDLILQVAHRLGYPAERIETGSLSTVKKASQIVAERLKPGAIVVSLSKGGADVLQALHANPRARCWLQIGGLVRGTPLADALLQAPHYQQVLIKTYLTSKGGSWELVRELTTRQSIPPALPILNVLGCPLTFHLQGSTRRRHAFLKRPNDGTILLEDSYLGDHVLPIWGADHYFRIPGMANRIERLLNWAANQ